MGKITINADVASKLNSGMARTGQIELPFPVIYIWAHNGQPSYKQQGGALYYGGWACKAEDMTALAEQKLLDTPVDWKKVTIATREGGEFEAFTSRYALIAPIAKRESWIDPENNKKRTPKFVDGARRHLQVLCYLGERIVKEQDGEKVATIKPWGPVVLTAKGYQARNMLDAFSKWDKATSQVRFNAAPGVPAWCFYLSIGTFGKERVVLNAGKPGAQSPITPIGCYLPETIDEELMVNLFVGEEVAAVMADLQSQAQEWLGAWSVPVDETQLVEAKNADINDAPENFPDDFTF